jgi:hypothetical protein
VTKPFYSFDTSAFIKGRRDLLPPEVFPSFWANVEQMIMTGVVRSTDEVRRELGRRDDDTNAWATSQDGLFVELDEDIQVATTLVLTVHPKLTGTGGGRHQADPGNSDRLAPDNWPMPSAFWLHDRTSTTFPALR